jgi:transcription elongation factor Elf1
MENESRDKKIIIRKCSVCGKRLAIKINKRRYTGGYYFGKININPKSENWYDLRGRLVKVKVKGEKPKLVEYWECEECYKS